MNCDLSWFPWKHLPPVPAGRPDAKQLLLEAGGLALRERMLLRLAEHAYCSTLHMFTVHHHLSSERCCKL